MELGLGDVGPVGQTHTTIFKILPQFLTFFKSPTLIPSTPKIVGYYKPTKFEGDTA